MMTPDHNKTVSKHRSFYFSTFFACRTKITTPQRATHLQNSFHTPTQNISAYPAKKRKLVKPISFSFQAVMTVTKCVWVEFLRAIDTPTYRPQIFVGSPQKWPYVQVSKYLSFTQFRLLICSSWLLPRSVFYQRSGSILRILTLL